MQQRCGLLAQARQLTRCEVLREQVLEEVAQQVVQVINAALVSPRVTSS